MFGAKSRVRRWFVSILCHTALMVCLNAVTLVLWGEKDVAVLRGNLYDLERRVSRLTVRRHSGASHWIVHEDPAWVNEAVRSFIESQTNICRFNGPPGEAWLVRPRRDTVSGNARCDCAPISK